MKLSKVWVIAEKDIRVFLRKRSILYSVVLFPVLVSVGLPLVLEFAGRRSGGLPGSVLPQLLDAFGFFFIIGASFIPTTIASYSIVGEKMEHSLEPLLATPTTDGELLLGKSVAAFFPPLIALYIGSVVFMALCDLTTHTRLGYLYYPNGMFAVILLVVAPLAAVLSISASVLISSRVSDVRTAQQLGALIVLPFGGVYVATETHLITLSMLYLGIIAAVLAVIDVALLVASTRTFHRDQILTRWK